VNRPDLLGENVSSAHYDELFRTLDALCEGEKDAIALMATIACELFAAFDKFSWVGFYRNVGDETLKIGPYQGAHGCLTIPFNRGICGRCAREKAILNIPDVTVAPEHIACSSSTKSELVVPILNRRGRLVAVLDIDSDETAAFTELDEVNLPRINKYFESAAREGLPGINRSQE
jgi:GAF domain-containing protein